MAVFIPAPRADYVVIFGLSEAASAVADMPWRALIEQSAPVLALGALVLVARFAADRTLRS